MLSVSIIILNWNGRDLLAQGLPSVFAAVNFADFDVEVIVVDNGSTDGSADFVRSGFPTARVVATEKNHGFGEGNNLGVKNSTSNIVVLLNNDMVVDKNFLNPLLKPFQNDREVFA